MVQGTFNGTTVQGGPETTAQTLMHHHFATVIPSVIELHRFLPMLL